MVTPDSPEKDIAEAFEQWRDSYILHDDQVRSAFISALKHFAGMRRNEAADLFDRWIADHDHHVRTDYEARRPPGPIHIDNINGVKAADWLKEHDKEVARKTRHKIADFIKYAGEERIGNAVRYIDFEHELTEADIKRGQEIAEVIRTNSDGLG